MRRGFTLVELLVAIAVVCVGIGIPVLIFSLKGKETGTAEQQATKQAAEATKKATEQTCQDFSSKVATDIRNSLSHPNLAYCEKPQAYVYVLSTSDGKVLAEIECHSILIEDCSSSEAGIQSITWLDKDKIVHRQYIGGQIIEVTNKPLQIEGNFIIRERR